MINPNTVGTDTVIEIKKRLEKIEKDFNVRIIYAVESGSRAWGFNSANSDYDVRYIYLRPQEWYLCIDNSGPHHRDVIDSFDHGMEGEIDLSGWDLIKTLSLAHKSNPTLFEWFASSQIYRDTLFAEELKKATLPYYSPEKVYKHYSHMAFGNLRRYLDADSVFSKKYLYVLRPTIACLWVERFSDPNMPMDFGKLVAGVSDLIPADVFGEINLLLKAKMSGMEMGMVPRNKVLEDWLRAQLERPCPFDSKQQLDNGPLNKFFRDLVVGDPLFSMQLT